MMERPALIRISALSKETQLTARKLRHIAALGGAELWPGSRKWFLRSQADHVLSGRPLSSGPYGVLPSQPLLYRAQVCEWLGLTDSQYTHMLRHLPAAIRKDIALPIGTTKTKCQYRRDRIVQHILATLL